MLVVSLVGIVVASKYIYFPTQAALAVEHIPLRQLGPRLMKFSSALKFNAISDWWDAYIAYDQLKRVIYQVEKEEHAARVYTDEEARLLFPSSDARFSELLDIELDKISRFYNSTVQEVFTEIGNVEDEVKRIEEEWEGEYHDYSDDEESLEEDDVHQQQRRRRDKSRYSMSSVSTDDAGPSSVSKFASKLRDSISTLPGRGRSSSSAPALREIGDVWHNPHPSAIHARLTLKRSIVAAFVKTNNLKSYVEVNENGFSKILKKYVSGLPPTN